MWPNPLHPAIVHFPIVLVVLLPLLTVAALWVIRRGAAPRRAWLVPLLAAAALTASAWLAVQTGKSQEDRVESIVPAAALHEHEEAAERLLALSAIVLLVTATGLAGGVVGRAARYVTVAGALGLLTAGVWAGHTGGQLVYAHGAAGAYASAAAPAGDGRAQGRPGNRSQSDREHRAESDGE